MGQKFGKGFGVLESTDHENGQVLETLPRVCVRKEFPQNPELRACLSGINIAKMVDSDHVKTCSLGRLGG